MMTAGASPVSNILGKISLASFPESSPWLIKATNWPMCSAATGDSAIPFPAAFNKPIRSPITQLAVGLRSPRDFGGGFEIIACLASQRQNLCVIFAQSVGR